MRRLWASIVLVAMMMASLSLMPPVSASHVTNTSTDSRYDGLDIWMSVYKPASASATNKVPMIIHSHGWSGSRTSSEGAFTAWLTAGFGMLSFDQRGHGQTGGIAHVENPDIEGQDVISVIDYIATLDWVKKDLDANGDEITNDPVLGAIGGSYGGGYQMIGALTEVRDFGRTRFNALAPEITWNDLPRSLAPSDVPRTLWDTLLYAVGIPRLPDYVHQSFAVGTATGTFPNGEIPGVYNLKDRFHRNSPAWFAENGLLLDIPVLFGQGTSDNLFPLNEAYHNFEEVLTDGARAKSIVIGYNGGHVLPAVVPPDFATISGDGCSGEAGFGSLSRSFFATVFARGDPSTLQAKPYNITSSSGGCIRVDSLDTYTSVSVPGGTVATPTAAGAPLNFELASGPLTIVGIPRLRGTFTSLGADARAFFALAVGETPATAQIIQGNVMPLRQRFPALGELLDLELAGVAVEVPAGQKLYLTVSAISDMFTGTSRTPGVFVIENAVADLPIH